MRDNHPKLKLVGGNAGIDNIRNAAAQTTARKLCAPAKTERLPALLRAGEATAARQIALENRAAGANPDLSPTDPRWVFAVRTQNQLEGAVLSPDRRIKLMHLAQQLGIRTFDANMIVALVQDRARRGAPLDDLTGTLSMLGLEEKDNGQFMTRWLMALACAAPIAALLIRWVLNA